MAAFLRLRVRVPMKNLSSLHQGWTGQTYCVVISEVCGKVKKKYLKVKYRPAAILLNVNAMICFKFKLHLKSKNNKIYSSIIVNFHTGLR